jgi:hypothetical protein
VLQRWTYQDSELIVCTFGSVTEEVAEATWTGSGIEVRSRSGDEIANLGMWSEAEPEITISYSPGQLHVTTRAWDSKLNSYVPFIGITYYQEAGSVRSESSLLAIPTNYDQCEADRLVLLITERYSQPESYDEVLDSVYLLRDMGLDEADKVISTLEDIRPNIVTSAALSEYLSSVVRELEQVRALAE